MIYAKTAIGLQAFQQRDSALSSKARSVLIMIDGKKDISTLLPMIAAIGADMSEVDFLAQAGYIVPTGLAQSSVASISSASISPSAATGSAAPRIIATAKPPTNATPAFNQFTQAYQIACQLTSELGLRGFRLNLSVEGATKIEDLVQLAPKLRDAVGDKKFLPLAQILGIRL